MTEVWVDTFLGEVFDSITNGVNCDQKSNSGKHLITRIETISKGVIDLERIGRADLKDNELAKYRLANNDILFSHINSPIHVGKTALFDKNEEVYHGVNLLRIRTIKGVNPKFLRYFFLFLYSSGFWRTVAKQSVNQASVNQKDISMIPFSYPSLAKQAEIVEKLELAFSELDLLEDNLELSIQKLDQLLHSILNAEFARSEPGLNLNKPSTVESISKDVVRIGDVCKLMTGGTPSRARPEYFENGTIRWLVSGDINKVEIFDCDGRITPEAMKSSNAKILPMNSVMIALNGQGKTRGTVALLRTEATCNQSLVSISPMNENQLLPEFLFHNLRMRYQEIRRMTGDDGNDRRGLNMILIRDIEIPLPSLQKQRETVEKLDIAFAEIERIKNQIAVKKDFAGMLRQSLLSDYFSPKDEKDSA